VQALAAAEPKHKALPDLAVCISRSLCETPFSLKLACPVDGAAIRYTADGSEPTWANGNEYSDSLLITNSTVLRAAAFKDRARMSSITTHSYIFLEQAKHQPKNPPGFPAAVELLKQVKALSQRERQKFVLSVLTLEEATTSRSNGRKKHVKWPDVEVRAKRIFGERVFPNLVLLEREEAAL
jgi:hypothetical protein